MYVEKRYSVEEKFKEKGGLIFQDCYDLFLLGKICFL